VIAAADLLDLPLKELARLLREGHPVDPTALDDRQYRGTSLGLPRWVERLTWKTFVKTFHRDPATGALRGWNVRLEQDGLDAPVRPKTNRAGDPRTFGHYVVVDDPDPGPGLLIKYTLSPLRDPLVALNPGDPALLLGMTYVHLGLKISTLSYFSLQLDGPLEFIPGA